MSTLREHLDQQIREIDYWLTGNQTTFGNLGLLRLLREHAVASLTILDESERASTWLNGENVEELRLVPDPPVSS